MSNHEPLYKHDFVIPTSYVNIINNRLMTNLRRFFDCFRAKSAALANSKFMNSLQRYQNVAERSSRLKNKIFCSQSNSGKKLLFFEHGTFYASRKRPLYSSFQKALKHQAIKSALRVIRWRSVLSSTLSQNSDVIQRNILDIRGEGARNPFPYFLQSFLDFSSIFS